jgi:GAF domain-containing protein
MTIRLRRLAISLFTVRYPYKNILDQHRARGLIVLAWLLIGLMTLVLAIALAQPTITRVLGNVGGWNFGVVDILTFSIWVLMTALSFSIVWLVNTGRLSIAALVVILLLLALSIITYMTSGTQATHQLLVFGLPIVAAGVLTNRRIVVWITVIEVCAMVAIRLIALTGALNTLVIPINSTTESLWYGVLMLFITMLLLLIFASGPRAMERQMNSLMDEVRSLSTFSKLIVSSGNLDELLTQTVETIRDELGYYHAQLYLIEDDSGLIILRAASGLNTVQIAALRKRLSVNDAHIIASVVRKGAAQRIAEDTPAEWRVEFLPSTRAGVLIPIRQGQQVYGLLDVQSVRPDAFTAADIAVLDMVASQLAVVVQNNRLIIKLKDSNRQRVRADQAAQPQAAERRGREANRDGWSRYLQSRMENAFGYDWNSGLIQPNPTLSEPQLRAMNNAMPETFQEGREHVMTIPISLRGTVLGVIEFRASRPTGWTSRQIELARVIAQRLALALDNLRLFEQAQITASREQIASQLSARLQTRTDIESLLELATDAFQEALGATRTNIRLGSPEDAEVTRPLPLQSQAQHSGSNVKS